MESLQGPAVDEDDSAPHLDSRTSKPLRRGKQFFESGHVTCMSDNRTLAHYNVKANVLASMKQISYNVHLSWVYTVVLFYTHHVNASHQPWEDVVMLEAYLLWWMIICWHSDRISQSLCLHVMSDVIMKWQVGWHWDWPDSVAVSRNINNVFGMLPMTMLDSE